MNEVKTFVIDAETTSRFANSAEIIQLAALEYYDDVREWKMHNFYFNPKGTVPAKITELTHLTKKGLVESSDGLFFEEQFEDFKHILNPSNILVGHNVRDYDMVVIKNNLRSAGIPCLLPTRIHDTMRVAKQYPFYKRTKIPKLSELYLDSFEGTAITPEKSEHIIMATLKVLGVDPKECHAHNAMYDVVKTALIYRQGKNYVHV